MKVYFGITVAKLFKIRLASGYKKICECKIVNSLFQQNKTLLQATNNTDQENPLGPI